MLLVHAGPSVDNLGAYRDSACAGLHGIQQFSRPQESEELVGCLAETSACGVLCMHAHIVDSGAEWRCHCDWGWLLWQGKKVPLFDGGIVLPLLPRY